MYTIDKNIPLPEKEHERIHAELMDAMQQMDVGDSFSIGTHQYNHPACTKIYMISKTFFPERKYTIRSTRIQGAIYSYRCWRIQ